MAGGSEALAGTGSPRSLTLPVHPVSFVPQKIAQLDESATVCFQLVESYQCF